MSLRASPLFVCLAVMAPVLLLPVTPALSQSPARLGLTLSNGLPRVTISGDPGSTWTLQFNADATQPNDWQALSTVVLASTPAVVVDPNPPTDVSRFYRAQVVQTQMPTNVIVTNMAWFTPGTFVMGSPVTEEGRQADETQHTATLTHGFFIGKFLVTQADYLSVMGNNPSWFNGLRGTTDYGTDLSRPAESVYWFSADSYCAQLTQNEQLAGRLPAGWVYRLPTEAEWEFACRAGTITRFSYGDDPGYTQLANYSWYSANSTNLTHAVGQKLPNPAGLCDMHGDVYEWCQDYYGSYPAGPVTDPQGPASGTTRIFRGGSWAYGGAACRSAGRYQADPATRVNFIGFRVVVVQQ